MDFKRVFWVVLLVMMTVVASSCATKKQACSIDADCKTGDYCSESDECKPMAPTDFSVAFVDMQDPLTVFSEDRETNSPIDATVRLMQGNNPVSDGTVVSLKRWTKSTGDAAALVSAKTVNGIVRFVNLPVKYPYDRLTAFYQQNPEISTDTSLQYNEVDYTIYYIGKDEKKRPLDGTTFSAVDDFDPDTDGIQLHLIADLRGFLEKTAFSIATPDFDAKPLTTVAYNPPPENVIDYGILTFPHAPDIRLISSTSDGFSSEVMFHISESTLCTFSVDLKSNQLLGLKDDELSNNTTIDKNVVLSNFKNCPEDSVILVELWKTDASDKYNTVIGSLDAASVTVRLPFEASNNATDLTKAIFRVINDQSTTVGNYVVDGIIADMVAPSFVIAHPTNGQIYTQADDTDDVTPGIQIAFSGDAADAISTTVTMTTSINETVIDGPESRPVGTITIPTTLSTPLDGAVASFSVTDEAGNETVETATFSVVYDSRIDFTTICTKTDGEILNNMWLNRSDDTDGATAGLQCQVVVTVHDSVDADQVILTVDGVALPAQPLSTSNAATFAISAVDSASGIVLHAETAGSGTDKLSTEITVRIDTVAPVVILTNSLSLTDGDATPNNALDFTQACVDEVSCEFDNHVDGEAWSGWSTTAVASLTNLNSSAHIFHAKARDAAGNEGIETLFHWTVDSREPQTSITLSPTKTTNLDYAHFAFMADKSPITFECQLFKESVQIVPATGWDDCSAGTQNYFSLTNGSYEFRVRATDSLSNVESTPASFDWIVTQDLPVTTILTTNPVGAIVPNKTMVFTYESSIAESSFECQLLKDGAVEEDWTDCDSGTKSYSSLGDGSYLFKVKATTAYGEEEIDPAQHGWSIDATKPLVTVSSKPPAVTGFAAAQFVFACEGEAAPCTFECALDGAVATACTSPQTTADLAEGAHTFVITAIDNAGNRSDVVTDQLDPHVNSIEWTYTVSAALEVSITSQPTTVTNLDNATFEFVATRIAATFVCKLDSDAAVACTSPFDYTSLSDGAHTFAITASEGGDEASASYSWNVDKTPPTITFSLTPADPTIETGASFAFSADETVVAFECKADSESWHACSSPTVYAAGTFGTDNTVSSHSFDVRAVDTAGNEGSANFAWEVDLRKPTISWTTPVPHPDGQILVGPEDDKYLADDLLYAIDVVVTVEGAKVGSEIKVTGFHEPPGYTPVLITTTASKTYVLQIGLQQGNYLLNNINIEVESLNGLKASISKAVVVVIDKPSISWNSPSNGKVFLVGESSGTFRFNLWNSDAGSTIELVRDDTDVVVGTGVTAGAHGTLEFIEIQATLPDSCESYKFYARFVDPVSGDMLYTDATDVKESRTVRSIGFDMHPPVIGEVTITGISDTDRYLNKNDNLNPLPLGVMQTDFTITLSDTETPADNKRVVTLFTNIGSGDVELINKNNIADTVLFEKLPLSEHQHTVTVIAKDCSGNSASTTLVPFIVDTKSPLLTLSSPIGSYQPQLLVVADDPTLGTINGDDEFAGVTLRVDANEELADDATVVQKIYNYTGVIQNAPGDELPDATVTYGTTYLECALPNLTNSQHDFIVTAHDKAGNESVLGNDQNDWFLVDTITPQAEITNLSDGDSVDTDAEPGTPGFQAEIIVNFTNINQLTKYELSTIPILSQGGAVDTARVTVVYSDWISGDETRNFISKTSGGWWRLIVSVEATTSNESETTPIDVFVDSPSPSLTLKKSYNYPQGDGDILHGADPLNPAWLHSKDISCSGDNCNTDFEVWTNAAVGTTVDMIIDSGAPLAVVTIDGGGGASVALFDGVTLDTSLAQNVITITVNSTTPRTDIRYIEVDKTNPTLTVINPTCSLLNTPCNIKPLTDSAGTPEIELAEIGFGIEDASNTHSGNKIQFKADHQIIFQVDGAVDGYVDFANDIHLENDAVPIQFDAANSRYIADFSSLLIQDDNTTGQTDLDLILTVTETPSGAFTTYMIKVHLDMATPVAINTTGLVATDSARGSAAVRWQPVQGNNSTLGGNSDTIHQYNIRYENYGLGNCSLETNFDSAHAPLETVAGPPPSPQTTEMNYTFYYSRADNGKDVSDVDFREADIHKNGENYCFAVRAVDAVYAADSTVLRLNRGEIAPTSVAPIGLEKTTLITNAPGTHLYKMRTLGDLNGDGINDVIIGDGYTNSLYTVISKKGFSPIIQKLTTPDDAATAFFAYNVASGGDVNGDGVVDVVVSDLLKKSLHIFYGDDNSTPADKSDDFIHLERDEKIVFTDYIYDIAVVGDITNSNCDSFAVGFAAHDSKKGKVELFGCGATGDGTLATADATLFNTVLDEQFGSSIRPAGDVNSDGFDDFVVFTKGVPTPTLAKLILGSATLLDDDQTVTITPETGSGVTDFSITEFEAGRRFMFGDINGDGFDDAIAPDGKTLTVLLGDANGYTISVTVPFSDVMETLIGGEAALSDETSGFLADLNSDGFDDFLIGGEKAHYLYSGTDTLFYADPTIYFDIPAESAKITSAIMSNYGVIMCEYSDTGGCDYYGK